ncbi:MAG: hypothetical protein AABX54_00475, partial [Nanoarchaeota archaeon]
GLSSLSPFLSFLKLFGITLGAQTKVCQNGQCVDLGLKLIGSDAQTPVNLGDKFTIKCNFGIPFLGCVQAKHGNNNCVYTGYSGNDSTWSCAAKTIGTINNYCNLFDYAGDSRCIAQTNQIQSTKVI